MAPDQNPPPRTMSKEIERITFMLDSVLPCPFCGERLVIHSDHHGEWVAHRDEVGPCVASTTQLMTAKDRDDWNKRTIDQSTSTMRDELERVKGGFELVAGVQPEPFFKTKEDYERWRAEFIEAMKPQSNSAEGHIIIGPSNQCMCGIYGDVTFRCTDYLPRTQLAEAKAELKEECQLVDSETVKRRLAESQLAELRTGLSVKDEMLKEHVQQLAAQSARVQALEAALRDLRDAFLRLNNNCYPLPYPAGDKWKREAMDKADAALSQEQATPRNG